MKIVFKKGTKKPWKVLDKSGQEVGSGFTKVQAQAIIDKGPSSAPPAKPAKPGVDFFLDKAAAEAGPTVGGSIAKIKGRAPMKRGLLPDESMASNEEDLNP